MLDKGVDANVKTNDGEGTSHRNDCERSDLSKKAFQAIAEGIEDAIAFSKGAKDPRSCAQGARQ